MKKFLFALPLTLLAFLVSRDARSQGGPAATLPAEKGTPAIASAAKAFLATLDDAQRAKVLFDFNDQAQRKRWSNLPVNSVPRGGLRLGDLTPLQRQAAMDLLAAALSPRGYEKTLQIVEGDEMLRGGQATPRGAPPDRAAQPDRSTPGGRTPRGARGGGGGAGGGGGGFGHDNYYLSFLGQPSLTDPWMIQFGGHHLGLNITIAADRGTLAPSHTGAQPATYQIEGKTIRPLGREADEAFILLSALDDTQRKKAILGFEVRDLVLGPGHDGQTIQPEGIKGSDLSKKQQQMLLDVAANWTGIMQEPVAAAKRAEIEKNIADTWFAWSGPTDKAGASYFRIQGPTVLIEFAPQRLGGDLANHIHTIYRDPTNDYGAKWWKP